MMEVVVVEEYVRDRVYVPSNVGVCLFVLSLTAIRGRQTAKIGKLN